MFPKWQSIVLTVLYLFCFTLEALAVEIRAASSLTAGDNPTLSRFASSSDADALVQIGKDLWVSGDTQGAQKAFEEAVEIMLDHEEANFYLGSTRIVNVYEGNPEAFTLLLKFGFQGQGPDDLPIDPEDVSIFTFLADVPHRAGAHGFDFPADSPNLEDIKAFAEGEFKPEIDLAFDNFAKVSDDFVSFVEVLRFFFFETQIEFDQSDVLLARSSLHALKAALSFLEAYDVRGDFEDLYIKSLDETIDFRKDLLEMDLEAFTVADPRATSRGARELVKAISLYLEGSDAIRAEMDPQEDDFVHFDPADVEAAQFELRFRNALIELRASLNPRFGSSFPAGEVHLKDVFLLGRFFHRTIDVRALQKTGGMVDFLVAPLGRECRHALRTLNMLMPDYYQLLLPENFGVSSPTELDFTDVLLARSALKTYKAYLMFAEAYEHNLNLAELGVRFTEGVLDWTEVLSTEFPEFGVLLNRVRARRVKNMMLSASEDYLAASDAIGVETDDQSDDLIVLEEKLVEGEMQFREILEAISGLEGFIPIRTSTGDDLSFDLNAFFRSPFDIRPFFPEFEGAFYVPGTFPDPTFGGILLSVNNDDLIAFFGVPRD